MKKLSLILLILFVLSLSACSNQSGEDTAVIKEDSTVIAPGDNGDGQLNVPAESQSIKETDIPDKENKSKEVVSIPLLISSESYMEYNNHVGNEWSTATEINGQRIDGGVQKNEYKRTKIIFH